MDTLGLPPRATSRSITIKEVNGMKRRIFTIAVLLFVVLTSALQAIAQTPPLKAVIALDKSVYEQGQPVRITLTLFNASGQEVITPEGISARPFETYFTFIDPDGKPITAKDFDTTVAAEDPPPPPVVPDGMDLIQAEPVETLAPNWSLPITIPNARTHYTLTKLGDYSVTAKIPFRAYAQVDYTKTDPSTGLVTDYSKLENTIWDGALESNTVRVAMRGAGSSGTIKVSAIKHIIGLGNRPICRKEPIPGMAVRVYEKKAGTCVGQYGIISWPHYDDIWSSCPATATGETDLNGQATFAVAPGTYIVIGRFDPEQDQPGDELFVADNIIGIKAGQTRQAKFLIMERADRKHLPCKYTVETGSNLMIVEPEYIEWSDEQELYPFVFDSDGDWSVQTSVSPPEGFVTDYRALATDVNTELKSLQFTLTDVGTKWTDAKVTHKIKHKGKKPKEKTLESKIGVKLTERLAKQKGLTVFGEKIKKKK
jgi:hypothetical protein